MVSVITAFVQLAAALYATLLTSYTVIATAARNAARALPGSIVTISRTISNTVVSGSASSHQLRSTSERIRLMSEV